MLMFIKNNKKVIFLEVLLFTLHWYVYMQIFFRSRVHKECIRLSKGFEHYCIFLPNLDFYLRSFVKYGLYVPAISVLIMSFFYSFAKKRDFIFSIIISYILYLPISIFFEHVFVFSKADWLKTYAVFFIAIISIAKIPAFIFFKGVSKNA